MRLWSCSKHFHLHFRVVQSQDKWIFGDFNIHFTHAPLPYGSGGGHKTMPGHLETALKKKRCFIQIPKDDENLCCARAIVTAKARIDKHNQWNTIRQGRKIQRDLAVKLQQKAGIPEGQLCGLEEWKKFQNALGSKNRSRSRTRVTTFHAVLDTQLLHETEQIGIRCSETQKCSQRFELDHFW